MLLIYIIGFVLAFPVQLIYARNWFYLSFGEALLNAFIWPLSGGMWLFEEVWDFLVGL